MCSSFSNFSWIILSGSPSNFRKGYSTVDNIFVLHALIDLYFSFGKKLYCTFVDFKKAFDSLANRVMEEITKLLNKREMFQNNL
jgi:hypothetical protein